MIIIEGPDCSGKTTLVKQLLDEGYGKGGVHHQGVYSTELGVDKQTWVAAHVLPDASTAIFDRLHLGEFVYGPVYRGGSRITPRDCFRIEDALMRHYGTRNAVIYCLPPWLWVEKVWNQGREEMFRKQGAGKMNEVWRNFNYLYDIGMTSFEQYKYDWTDNLVGGDGFPELLAWLKERGIK